MAFTFPYNYPASPPSVRVVYPRFFQYSGHITIGGSICNEYLTTTGWNSKTEIVGLLHAVKQIIVEGGALIDLRENLLFQDYSAAEAQEAYNRVARQHNWVAAPFVSLA
eukprot:TRINITY_DN2734_c0_g1_i1.p3 TRINITY_DN2734_c0_g1~~TRINITY_DN2734_c0_g1_i1.p3  ORF type:complete len:109 (-),score=22.46 TRINITY_DN2734_c0_g1_i1:508-834(-)